MQSSNVDFLPRGVEDGRQSHADNVLGNSLHQELEGHGRIHRYGWDCDVLRPPITSNNYFWRKSIPI